MKKIIFSPSACYCAINGFALFRFVIGIALVLAAALALSTIVRGQTQAPAIGTLFLVNSTGDGPEASMDNQCDTVIGNGICTLRAAIELVDARNNGGDGIRIDIPGTDPGCSGGICTINLGTVLPGLVVPVSLSGPGADKLIVQRSSAGGTANFRIFNVTTTGSTVSISGITIANGVDTDGNGGGIQNAGTGTVNVTNCTLQHNVATNGGAISNASGGQVNLTNCLLSGNQSQLSNSDSSGGGVYNIGTVTITNSTLSGNIASGGSNFSGFGGGVFNHGTLTVVNSTINLNHATSELEGFGGGVYNTGNLEVINSTIFSNEALNTVGTFRGAGGGIFNSATAIVTNSTITSNIASNETQNSAGGIQSNTPNTQVKSSIIAQNFGSGPDVSGSFTSSGFNLIGATDGSTGFNAATDQTGTTASPLDPKLSPMGLQNNGGPTQTVALLSGSPAIDKGISNGLTTDQRGVGFLRTIGNGTDIGAFEFGAHVPVVSRKTHGSSMPPLIFDIDLPPSNPSFGPVGVECRRNTGADTTGPNAGRDHEVIISFPSAVTVGGVSVTNMATSTFSVSSQVVTVDLRNVLNAERLGITLTNVSDGTNTNNFPVSMGVLLGDTTGDRFVNSADISQTKSKSGQSVDGSNFREDVNADGFLNSADISFVKSKSGSGLP